MKMFLALLIVAYFSGTGPFTALLQGQDAISIYRGQAKATSPNDTLHTLILPFQPGDGTEKQINSDFAGIKIENTQQVVSHVTDDDRYLMYGNLFHTGKTYALVQLPNTDSTPSYDANNNPRPGKVALAQFVNGHWQVRGLWKIGVVWLSKEWKQEPHGDFIDDPPACPFEFVDFVGDGVPEILFAGESRMHFHYYYLLRFDAQTNELRLLEEADHRPSGEHGYMIKEEGSGRRRNTSAVNYLKWRKENFVIKAFSRDVESEPGSESIGDYTEIDVVRQNGSSDVFKIGGGARTAKSDDPDTPIPNEKPYAVITFNWKKTVANQDDEKDAMEEAWIFEHLTGLPRMLYQSTYLPKTSLRFEDYGEVMVKGSDEAIQRLNPEQVQKR